MRILLYDHDPKFAKQIHEKLLDSGYQADMVESLDAANYYVEARNYDLVILGWCKEFDPIKLIAETKKESPKTSIIVVSEFNDKDSEIKALVEGADDYVHKDPSDLDILTVRIEAKLRFGVSNIIEIEDLIINPEEEKIIYKNQEIELKGKPFEVLTHLAINKEQIVSKEQLLDAIWEEPELVTPNVIEVAINQIRQKMDKPLQITTIETVRRRGYRFCFPKEPQG